MMQYYDWKSHYDAHITEVADKNGFRHFRIDNETGTGEVITCSVFPGVLAVLNDLRILRCGKAVPEAENTVEITCCMEGRYECEVNSRYCFYIGHGDLTIGTVGRTEAGGGFPTRCFSGLTLFLDLTLLEKQYVCLLPEMGIDLGVIRELAKQKPRRFVLHNRAEFLTIILSMAEAERSHRLPALRIKTIELMMLLSDPDLAPKSETPVYISRKLAQLAKDVQRQVTADLSRHLTLTQLSAQFQTSPTAIKTAFKSVYGESLRDYMKACRLQEAQRLLRETDLPVSEVAAAVGFANPGHFSVAFRERFYMTPVEYKKSVHFE